MICIVNESMRMPSYEAFAAVVAIKAQVRIQFAPSWSRMPVSPVIVARRQDVPKGAPMLVLVDDSDQADALGWHSESLTGQLVGLVGVGTILDAGGTLLQGAMSVSAVLSHEVLETAIDPFVSVWVDGPGARSWAFECADPVQGDCYDIDGVSVASFVMPHFFNPSPPEGARFDWLGQLSAPFSLGMGGYAVVRSSDGHVSQIGAAKPSWRLTSRSARRDRR